MSELMEWEGVIPDEPIESYHAREEFSASQIMQARKSGWEFKKRVLLGEGEQNKSQKLGSMAHELVYENKLHLAAVMPEFSPYTVEVPGVRAGTTKKKAITKKAQEQDWLERNKEKIVVSQTDFEKLTGMKEAIEADELVKSLLYGNWEIEKGFRYFDEVHQVACRFRADRLSFEHGAVIDFKTTQNGSRYAFKRSAERYGYYVQAAHYWLGLERLYPGEFKKFIFIAQDNSFPYTCGVYEMSDADFMIGLNERSRLLEKIVCWKKENYYPGYTEAITPLNITDYNSEDFEDETQEFE